MTSVVMPGDTSVSYRVGKSHVKNKKPFLVEIHNQETQLKSDEQLMLYGARPREFHESKEFLGPVCVKVFQNLYVGLVFQYEQTEAIKHLYLKDEEKLATLSLANHEFLKNDLCVVVRRICDYHDDGAEFFRGLVKEDFGTTTKIQLLDHFGEITVKKSELYSITPSYYDDQCHAAIVKLVMDGTVFFDPKIVAKVIAEVIQEQGSVDQMMITCRKPKPVVDDPDPHPIYFAKVRYPISSMTLEELVMDKLMKIANGKFSWTIEEKGHQCYICHAEPNGDVFVQMADGIVANLVSIFSRFDFQMLENEKRDNPLYLPQLKANDIYIAPFEDDVYRAKIVRPIDYENVEIEYIDFGNKSIVPLSELVRASVVSPVLTKIPPLCFKVVLKWVGEIIKMEDFKTLWEVPYEITVRREKIGRFPTVVLTGIEDRKNLNQTLVLKGWAMRRKSLNDTVQE